MIKKIILEKGLKFSGIFSHLFSVEYLKGIELIKIFENILNELGRENFQMVHLQNSLVTPRQSAEKVTTYLQQNPTAKVAIVFGRERVGLTNEELLQCRYHLHVPTNPEYSSLNLAMAVQLVSYELRQNYLALAEKTQAEKAFAPKKSKTLPKACELAYFFQETETLYQELGFIKNDAVMQKLQHLYQRAELEKSELNLLCGMLSAVKKGLKAQ